MKASKTAMVALPSESFANQLLQDNNDIIEQIVSFIGKNQYYFVAAINRQFYSAYINAFPKNKRTYYNISTIQHAKLCMEDRQDSMQRYSLCLKAAKRGHLPIVKCCYDHFYSHSCYFPKEICSIAARYGHLEILQFAHANGCPWDCETCSNVAMYGHLEILQYLHINGCPWDSWTCGNAATYGHLDILQYAHINGCPWHRWTCSLAAKNGHLEIVQYAHANGCPWDRGTCMVAARNGHLEILQYAHSNGCRWDSKTCFEAAWNGHLEILQYAYTNGCPMDIGRTTFRYPLRNVLVVQWLQDNGLWRNE